MKRFLPILFAASVAYAAGAPSKFVMTDTNGVLALPSTFISSNAAAIAAAIPSGSLGTNQLNAQTYGLLTTPIGVDVVKYGADPTGSADSTTSIQAAFDAAKTAGLPVLMYGEFKVSSTLTYKAPIYGSGMLQTKLLSEITNGTPVILVTNTDYWTIKNISIQTESGLAANFVGVQTTNTDGVLGNNHWYMENVYVRAAATGFDITGWIGAAVNCKARYCTVVGFKGTSLNAVWLNLVLEQDAIGLDLSGSSSVIIDGGVNEANGIGARFSACTAVKIDQYFENNTTHISVGWRPEAMYICSNFDISGFYYGSKDGGITIDNVRGVRLSDSASVSETSVNVTSLAKEVAMGSPFISAATSAIREAVPKARALNLMPNPRFYGGMRGPRFTQFGTTVTEEVTNTIYGHALRMTWPTNTTNPLVAIRPQGEVLNYFKGKTARLVGKVYVPDLQDFRFDYGTNLPANTPYLHLQAVGGAGGFTTQLSPFFKVGTWNVFAVELAIPSEATDLIVSLYGSMASATNQTHTSYVILGELVLCDSSASWNDMISGNWDVHPLAGRYEGNKWVGYRADHTMDAVGQWNIGDRIINSAPSVVGSGGYATTNQVYVLTGWRRITDGAGHTLNTDWVEERILTGQ